MVGAQGLVSPWAWCSVHFQERGLVWRRAGDKPRDGSRGDELQCCILPSAKPVNWLWVSRERHIFSLETGQRECRKGGVTTKSGWLVFVMSFQPAQLLPTSPRSGLPVLHLQLKSLPRRRRRGLAAPRHLLSKPEPFLLCHVGAQFFQSTHSDACFFPKLSGDFGGWHPVCSRVTLAG